MAIPLTNVTGDTELSGLSTTAYDLRANFALRPQLVYSMVGAVKPTRQSHQGDVVTFPFFTELTANTTALSTATPAEISGAAMASTAVTVSLAPYGDAIDTDAYIRGVSYVPVDSAAANLIGWQAGLSYDTLAREVLEDDSTIASADRKQFGGAAAETAVATGTHHITQAQIGQGVAQLRGDNAMPFNGRYVGYIHPDVAYDLRQEGAAFSTSEGTTRTPGTSSPGYGLWGYLAANSIPTGIQNAMIGSFGGVDWVETSTADVNLTGGLGGTDDTYTTTIIGQEALACAFSSTVSAATPQIVVGPSRDVLRRFVSVGWYWLGGFGEFREESRHLLITASSLGGT